MSPTQFGFIKSQYLHVVFTNWQVVTPMEDQQIGALKV